MSRTFMLGGWLLLLSLLGSCTRKEPLEEIQKYLIVQADSLDTSLQQLVSNVSAKEPIAVQRASFERARKYYKHLEPLTELYFPGFSETLNGPAIDEHEAAEEKVIEATGFQVAEELLYAGEDTDYEALLQETRLLQSSTNRLRQLLESNTLTSEHIFQACRLQLLRIVALGISGFDSPIALKSLEETKYSLEGIQRLMEFYADHSSASDESLDTLNAAFKRAQQYLSKHTVFNTFDRARFIRIMIVPLSQAMYAYQQSLGIANREFLTAVNLDNANYFSAQALNVDFFSNPANRNAKPELVALGKVLFFDPVLSGNNKRACASCHKPSQGFSDGRSKSVAFGFNNEISRNAPSILNASYQRMQFYDSRIMFLEDQITDVINNPTEMHGQIDEAVKIMSTSSAYRDLFGKAFETNTEITDHKVQMALAAYIRSLSSVHSRFDRYIEGDSTMLNEEEIAGLNLFMGKAKCGTCHFMPLFNGTVPPMFTKSESEVLGVPLHADTANATVDSDLGKYRIYGGDLNKFAFKTPTVRNAALTAPYMHNGVYQTLEEVVDFYNRRGGLGIGIELPNQTLPPDKLDLTKAEQKQIVAFIHALTDTTGLTSSVHTLPVFPDAALNARKVGGEY